MCPVCVHRKGEGGGRHATILVCMHRKGEGGGRHASRLVCMHRKGERGEAGMRAKARF